MFLLTTAPFTHSLRDSAIWRDVAVSRVWGSRFCFSFSLGLLSICVSPPRLLSGQQDVLPLWFYVITGWVFVMLSSSHLNRDRGLQGDWNITLSKIPVKIFTMGTLWLTQGWAEHAAAVLIGVSCPACPSFWPPQDMNTPRAEGWRQQLHGIHNPSKKRWHYGRAPSQPKYQSLFSETLPTFAAKQLVKL